MLVNIFEKRSTINMPDNSVKLNIQNIDGGCKEKQMVMYSDDYPLHSVEFYQDGKTHTYNYVVIDDHSGVNIDIEQNKKYVETYREDIKHYQLQIEELRKGHYKELQDAYKISAHFTSEHKQTIKDYKEYSISLADKIEEFNSLPWYKRLFTPINYMGFREFKQLAEGRERL